MSSPTFAYMRHGEDIFRRVTFGSHVAVNKRTHGRARAYLQKMGMESVSWRQGFRAADGRAGGRERLARLAAVVISNSTIKFTKNSDVGSGVPKRG